MTFHQNNTKRLTPIYSIKIDLSIVIGVCVWFTLLGVYVGTL